MTDPGMTALGHFRADKDDYLRDDPDSPLYSEAFTGLSYYPEAEAYAVSASFEPLQERDIVYLTTNVGDEQPYVRAGRASFTLGGERCTLTLFRPTFETENTRLFVPFTDATSGSETYGAGRYLEAPLLPDGQVLLDFNYAYSPFCAYSDRFRCPLPPAENRLPVPVYAGEKP